MACPQAFVTCLMFSLLFVGISSEFYPTYEVSNVRTVRIGHSNALNPLLKNMKHGRHKRQIDVADVGDVVAGAADSPGWTEQIKNVFSLAGEASSIVGPAVKLFGVVADFKRLALQREQMRIQERQFQEEMALKTIDLCSRICVTNWSPWAPCSAPCGGGTRQRTRTIFESDICKGKPCPHSLQEVGICNPKCANNGFPSGSGTCGCTRGFSGQCCNNEIICEFPGKPRNGHLEGEIPTRFGGVISYSCSDGFALVGDENRVCKANNQWGGNQPNCNKITCPEPEEPVHGRNVNKQALYQYGQEVVFRCNDGYVLTGPQKRQCTNFNGGSEGLWTGFTPLCLPVNCYDPGYPLNGQAFGTEFTLGHAVRFSCRKGFRLVGSERRECRENGKWNGHEAKCELITCEEPLIPRYGQLRRPRQTYRYGIAVRYECQDGYTLEGNSTSTCVEETNLAHLGPGGKWSSDPPICKATNCGEPGNIDNGAKDGSLFYYPNNVTFVCFDGYVLQGAAEIHCGYNGVWSAPPPKCNACSVNTFKANSDRRNECTPCPENTHTITDASTSAQQCVCNLGWTGEPGGPCTEITCPVLSALDHGSVTCEGNKYNQNCLFKCDTGYILDKGSSLRTCQDTGDWTGSDAQCTACPLNTYKSDQRSCLPCPVNSKTTSIASEKSDCKCVEGYQGPAGGPCSDANECTTNGGRGPCEDVCRNTVGNYVCECAIPGYIIDATVDKHVCKLDKTCRNLTEADAPDHGGLVCHWYREQNSQQCSVRCNPGYEFPARTNNYESCGLTTGYKWSHEERGEIIESCVEEFFPDFRLEGNSSYFVRKCRELTPTEQQQVKEDFAKMLTDKGICMRRATKVCDANNVGIICGATRSRRKRGVEEDVDEVNMFFEFGAKRMQPSECPDICRMLRIQDSRCEALCVPAYRRFLKALMQYTKRSLENLFAHRNKVSFRSSRRAFVYNEGSLETSDVIIDCPAGMENDGNCVPCVRGLFYSEVTKRCTKCPKHHFQANPQQTMCLPCPIGTYAPTFGSPSCSACPANRWGEECRGTCHCEHGQCNPRNGRCVCYSGWEGPQCNIDIQSCTADSCFPGVRCRDVPAPGTGFKCDPCPSGHRGDGTICVRTESRHRIKVRSVPESARIMKPTLLSGLAFGAE